MTQPAPIDASSTAANPYAPPSADLEELPALADGDVVAIRRAFLGREKAVKRLSWINLGLAIIWVPAALGSLFFLAWSALGRPVDGGPMPANAPVYEVAGVAFFHVGILSLNIALFVGLRRLHSWARWSMVAMAALSCLVLCAYLVLAFNGATTDWGSCLVTLVIGALVVAPVLYVLVTPPSKTIFTREYRGVVAQTRGMII